MEKPTRICEFRIERNGLITLKLFDGRQYRIDLAAQGLGSEANTNSVFLEFSKVFDKRMFDALFGAGLRIQLDKSNG